MTLLFTPPSAKKSILFGKLKLLKSVYFSGFVMFGLIAFSTKAQLAQFDFPATNSLMVSAKNANVSVSNMALSSAPGTPSSSASGTYFPNRPYIEASGWAALSQATAKYFYFTITASAGYTFSITNISFNAYATGAGPSAFGFAIGSSDLYNVDAPSTSLLGVNQAVSGQTGLSSATIKIQGWLNGSRASTGGGAFKLDDVLISGTVTPICTYPSTQISALGFSDISSTQQTLEFTRGNGTGGVLAIAKAGSAPTDPTSGTSYTASQNFGFGDLVGGGRAIYNGTAAGTLAATSQAVSSLSPETEYYYNFYEWNTTDICYNLSEVTGNAWTLSSPPAAHPATFSALAASSSQISLAFSPASSISNADGYIILARSDGATPTTSGIKNGVASSSWVLPAGTSVVTNITNLSTNSFSHSSLISNSNYCYLIIPYNWNGVNSETYNYLTDATVLTACATTPPSYPAGAYRTNPLFTGSYYFDSYSPDVSGNYPWQQWTGTWVDITNAAGAPQALLVKPPIIYLNGAYIDVAEGGIYNDIEISGATTYVYSGNTTTGLSIAANKTLGIKGGTLAVSGKMNIDAASAIHIYANAKMEISSASANFARAASSVVEVEDDGNLHVQSYLANLWVGEEKFHKNSNFYVQGWDDNALTYLIPSTTSVSSYSDGGFAACFGNLIIDMASSANNQPLQLFPNGFGSNLTNHDLIFRTAATGSGLGLVFFSLTGGGSYSTTIGRNLIMESGWAAKPVSFLNNLGTATVTIKGNVENNSNSATFLKLCESSDAGTSVSLNIDGDLKLSNSGVFDFNSAASGTGAVTAKLNLKGDISVASGATILTTYVNSNGILNFTGTGDGSSAALTQSIDIASAAVQRNRRINFVVNPAPSTAPYVQLARNLELGTFSTFTVKEFGLFDFGFTGNDANILTMVAGASTVKFTTEAGSILKISSPAGLIKKTADYGTSVGNVQGISATNRSYNNVATFWYTGKVAQTTGDGLNTNASGTPLVTSNGRVVIVDMADNNISLTPTIPFGLSNSTAVSTTGGKLDIRKGQFTETSDAYIFPATGFTGGTLYMATGTLYRIERGSNSAAGSAADLIPRMDGTTHPYNVQGTVELAGTGANVFQTLRGLRTYRAAKFSGANTFGVDYKNLSNTVTIDSALIITNSVVDCIDASGTGIPFKGTGGLTMAGGRLRIKALNNANPELLGTYTGSTYSLTGGTVEFYGSKATEQQQIRGNYNDGASVIPYYNVEINADAANYSLPVDKTGNVDLNSSFTVQGTMNVNSPAVLRMDKDESISGAGTFNVNSGAGLLYGGSTGTTGSPIEGLEASGTGVDAGNIRTSNRSFSPAATYGFVSPGDTPTGSGLPSTVAGLALFKSASTDQVVLTNPIDIAAGGKLSLAKGQLATTALKPLTLDATVTISGGTDNNSFVNGPLNWNTASAGSYLFPVGKSNTNGYFTFTTTDNLGDAFTGEYFTGTPPSGDLLGPSLYGIINTGYWQLERAGANGTKGILALNYKNPGIGQWSDGNAGAAANPTPSNTVQVVKRSAEAGTYPWYFTFAGAGSAGEYTPSNVDATVSSREIGSFSYFTLGYSFNSILPVKLLGFESRIIGGEAALSWKIADAKNLAGFEIQHSRDGNTFTGLAFLPSGGGTIYGYLHKMIPFGTHYYRLLVKETNGNSFFSQILQLVVNKPATQIMGLANTVVKTDAMVKILSSANQPAYAAIKDLLGRTIHQQVLQLKAGLNQLPVAAGKLAAGMYFITIVTGDKATETLKFVKE